MGRREEKKRITQSRILEMSGPLFVKRGYAQCTIDDIVKAVGIARGTFYLYFEDKASVFQALLTDLYHPIVVILTNALEDMAANHTNPMAHQIRYIRTAVELAQFIETKQSALPLHFREVWAAGSQGHAIRHWKQQIEDLAAQLIASSIQHGLIRTVPPNLTAMAVVGATERIIWGWLHGELPQSRRELAQELAALFWQGIAPNQAG
ncbi:MAG: TetR/AcrR family transcriptional regulator [Myxococcota bacterium]|nr:TetR/AcrR family transcriptional regulator [Myxococcota bacterium]